MIKQKLILYGAGERCRKMCKWLRQCDSVEITVILDSNPDKWGTKVENYQVEAPEKIKEFQDLNICITVSDSNAINDIREKLQHTWHYDLKKEVHYNELCFEALKASEKITQHIRKKMKANSQDRESAVLFVSENGFSLGGIQAWTKDICEALIKDGKENIYVISKRGDYEVPSLLQNHMIYINDQETFSFNALLNMIDVMIEKTPCKVVTTQPDNIILAAYLIKCCYPEMIEIIATVRGANEGIYQAYMNFKDCPDIYIGVSEDIRRDLIRLGINPEKVYSMCVPFECEKSLEHVYTEECFLPIRIGYAGRVEYSQKRMDLLMKLVEVLIENNTCFVMEIAGDGVALRDLEEFIRSNQLEEKVHLFGGIDRSEIPSFWKRQDICVNIADYEGRSHSIIEAMGNGAVPVVTATSGVREDITNDVNGYIVPIGDYHAMAGRIEYLAQHRERLSQMGKLAHDVVYPKSQIELHLEFWKDILSKELSN